MEISAVKVEPKLMDKLGDSVKNFLQFGGKHYHYYEWPSEVRELLAQAVATPPATVGAGPQIFASRVVVAVIAPGMSENEVRFQLDLAVVNDQPSPAALTWLETMVDELAVPLKQFVETTSEGRVPSVHRLPMPLAPRTAHNYCVEFEAEYVGLNMFGRLTGLRVIASINETTYTSSPFTVGGSSALGETLKAMLPDLKAPLAIDLPLFWLPSAQVIAVNELRG